MSEELKPCPFCGGAAREREQPGSFGGYGITEISCHGCSARASDKYDWNKRHTIMIEARAVYDISRALLRINRIYTPNGNLGKDIMDILDILSLLDEHQS